MHASVQGINVCLSKVNHAHVQFIHTCFLIQDMETLDSARTRWKHCNISLNHDEFWGWAQKLWPLYSSTIGNGISREKSHLGGCTGRWTSISPPHCRNPRESQASSTAFLKAFRHDSRVFFWVMLQRCSNYMICIELWYVIYNAPHCTRANRQA